MHTMLVAAPGPVQLENVKEQYLKHHGHKCAVERFLVVGDGGLSATLRRIPHVCNVSVKDGVTYVKAAQPADIDRNQLIEEDKRYRREVAKKNAAKAAAMGTSKAKAPAPGGTAGVAPAPNEQGKRPAEDAGSSAEKKQRTEAEAETLARMLIQGVVRILQNRQRANKGALPMSELENEFKELWKVPFNVKQANENDPVEFLRKWPSKVEIVPWSPPRPIFQTPDRANSATKSSQGIHQFPAAAGESLVSFEAPTPQEFTSWHGQLVLVPKGTS